MVNDVTIRIMLLVKLIFKLLEKSADVETAFLYGLLRELIYMQCPEGMVINDDEVIKLEKTIYGLVQSARAFFARFKQVLLKIGFEQSLADPCLFIYKRDNQVVYMAVWVDDLLCHGHKELLNFVLKEIGKTFKLKIEDSTNDYLSCEIISNKDNTKIWIGQPHLIRKIESTFGEMVKGLPTYRTPGTPNLGLYKPINKEAVISPKDQTLYRTGVGMLLYLVKYSRPDISNAVQELSKGMKEPTPNAFKELKRVLKFVLDTRNKGLKMEPKYEDEVNWEMTVYTDSD